ncbi:ATP-binding protein [Kitasatospora sp. NPDC096077]|uniref:ATP-binding protein n=1 Tax=Kitasatospora sp. NPDC096077 TaxID=3155544 RepID=UPI003322CCFB
MPETLTIPPPAMGEYSCWMPRHRKSVPIARRLLRDFLTGLDARQHYGDSAELVLGELLTNAVLHARTPRDRQLFVRFGLTASHLLVEVHDAGRGLPLPRPAGVDSECGRGLLLVARLAVDWGWRAREGGIGKTVWALLAPETGQGGPGRGAGVQA